MTGAETGQPEAVKEKPVYHDGKVVGTVPVTGDFERDRDVYFQFLKNKGLYREVTTLQAMYRQAMSFADVALSLNDEIQANPTKTVRLVTPFVVNHVFAMEMLLKALAAAHSSKAARHHNLAKLYAQLPAAARKAIDSAIAKRPPPAGYTLETVLRNLAESFVRWRYFFDMGGSACRFNIPSAMWAATVLEQACIDSGVKP